MQWNVRVIPLTGETFYPFLFSLPSNTIWNEKRCDVVYFTQTKHKVNLDPRMIIEWLEWAIVYFKWKTETSVMYEVDTFLYKSEFVIPTQFEVGENNK